MLPSKEGITTESIWEIHNYETRDLRVPTPSQVAGFVIVANISRIKLDHRTG